MTRPTDLRAAFEQGVAAALDPANAAAVAGGVALTTRTSEWLYDVCGVCHHTFRPGDRVEVRPGKREDGRPGVVAVHASAELPCAGGVAAVPESQEEVAAFFEGLNTTWPLPDAGHARPVRLEPGHWLLAGPPTRPDRITCEVCRHTFRPNEQVVICPCKALAPDESTAGCRAAVHRDRVRGLHCWETWNPGESRQHCPVTHQRLRANG